MKCPILGAGYLAAVSEIDGRAWDCVKEECALWDDELECCEWVSLRVTLKSILLAMWEIRDKVSRADQFTK